MVLSSVVAAAVPLLLKTALDAFDRHERKEITREQLEAELKAAMLSTLKEIEIAWVEASTKQFSAFMAAAEKTRFFQIGWTVTLVTQLAVLLWHQVGIPAYVKIFGGSWPSSGTTVEWAYLLVGGCIGLGPLVFRSSSNKAADLIGRLTGR